jgi:uncharacterized delta-60 repeat protein
MVRLLPDGAWDPSFLSGLYLMSTIDAGGYFQLNDLVIQPDGRILAAGTLQTVLDYGAPTGSGLARMEQNGALDPTFTAAIPYLQEARAMSLQSDGKIIAANNHYNARNAPASYNATLKRYNSDGSTGRCSWSATS